MTRCLIFGGVAFADWISAQPASEPPASEPAAPVSNGHGEVVTVDFGDLGPAAA